MKKCLLEQETIILYNQAEPTAGVYTNDPKLLKKLQYLTEKYPDLITMQDSLHYTVPKECVLIREPYGKERREAARQRALARGFGKKNMEGES